MKQAFRSWARRRLSPRLLARVNTISHVDDKLITAEERARRIVGLGLRQQYGGLVARTEQSAFLPLRDAEFAVYSQNAEDGITLALLERLGAGEKCCVEVGVEDGLECNTAILAYVFGWRALMIEGDSIKASVAHRAAERLAATPGAVRVENRFVTVENVNKIMDGAGFRGDIGVLSVDVDGVDYWLWKAITVVRPRVVIIEYNASLGPTASITVPYEAEFRAQQKHSSRYYHGASLTALENLGRRLGYSLVTCESAGVNAFFVREDLAEFAGGARSAEECYLPHAARTRLMSVDEQWALIRDLPYVEV
jgi:hypothetical protein